MTGYVTSGRFMADCTRERALKARQHAHWLFRIGYPNKGKEWAGRALNSWRLFRYYRARIDA